MIIKYTSYILAIVILSFISIQTYGNIYGGYVLIAWIWLILSLSPVFLFIYEKRDFNLQLLFYLIFLLLCIMVQPLFTDDSYPLFINGFHPIFTLLFSLIVVVPFFYMNSKNTDNLSELSLSIDSEIKEKCKKLIGEDKLKECFSILIDEVQDKKKMVELIELKRKWSKNEREKNLNINSAEWVDRQNARIAKGLLDLLD